MVSKKPTKPPAPTANHSAHLSSKLSTASNALLTSAFSPSHLQLGLFASTIVGLDAHRLRIHDITTGRLRCEFTLEKGVAVNSLAWGTVPSVDDQKDGKKKKKRKRLENGHDTTAAAAQVIVAAATSEGVIRLFSPSEGTLRGMLEGGHIGEVRQFVFSSKEEHEGRGWSVGVDGKLVEWDVRRKIALRYVFISGIALVPLRLPLSMRYPSCPQFE
jgi:U3 small nucleolar RNA-associated protein 5